MDDITKSNNPETEPKPQSQQELLSFCSERMQWALNMYPEQLRPSLETQANYTVEWLEMAEDIGPDEFSAALIQAVRTSEFFPVITKIRHAAGITEEQRETAGADAAWQYIQAYIDKGYACDWCTTRPALPPRIEYAVRAVGGLQAMNNVPLKNLSFQRKDFCEAWLRYRESSAALTDLLLAAPLETKRPQLTAGKRETPAEEKVDVAAGLRALCNPPREIRELTDAEIEDRREILRQQKEQLLSSSAQAERSNEGG